MPRILSSRASWQFANAAQSTQSATQACAATRRLATDNARGTEHDTRGSHAAATGSHDRMGLTIHTWGTAPTIHTSGNVVSTSEEGSLPGSRHSYAFVVAPM